MPGSEVESLSGVQGQSPISVNLRSRALSETKIFRGVYGQRLESAFVAVPLGLEADGTAVWGCRALTRLPIFRSAAAYDIAACGQRLFATRNNSTSKIGKLGRHFRCSAV